MADTPQQLVLKYIAEKNLQIQFKYKEHTPMEATPTIISDKSTTAPTAFGKSTTSIIKHL